MRLMPRWWQPAKFIAKKLLNTSYQFRIWALVLQSWSHRVCPSSKWYALVVLLAIGIADCALPLGIARASSLSVSVVDSQGNTKSQTVAVDGEHEIVSDDARSRQEIKAGLFFAKTDDKRSADRWYGQLKDSHYWHGARAKRKLSFPVNNQNNKDSKDMALEPLRWYWFNLSLYESDDFAATKRLSLNLGLGLELKSSRHTLNIEAGPGIISEERTVITNGDQVKEYDVYASARAWEEWTWKITDKISFSEEAEYIYDYADPDNYRVNAEGGISAQVASTTSGNLSLKVGPKVKYVNKPPTGKERTDIITSATIIFSF